MTRPKRQKLDEHSIESHETSQPLLNALKNASEAIQQQTSGLAEAQRAVSDLHAGTVNENGSPKARQYAQCTNAIMSAWQSATATYCDLLKELINLTAGLSDPKNSQIQTPRQLGDILKAADGAREAANEYSLIGNDGFVAPENPPRDNFGSDDEITVKSARMPSATEFSKTTIGGKVNGRKRKLSVEKLSAQIHDAHVAQVEYKDISAQVEARIKAKQDAKRSKEAERKRKRESNDSINGIADDLETIAVKYSEKPDRKKSRIAMEVEGGSHDPGSSAPTPSTPNDTRDGDTIRVQTREKRRPEHDFEETVVLATAKRRKQTAA